MPKNKNTLDKPFASTPEEAKEMRTEFYLSNSYCPVHNTRARWANTGKCMACADWRGDSFIDIAKEHEKIIQKRKEERLERDRLRKAPHV